MQPLRNCTIDWLGFDVVSQYFSHSLVVNFWNYTGGPHEPTLHRNPVKRFFACQMGWVSFCAKWTLGFSKKCKSKSLYRVMHSDPSDENPFSRIIHSFPRLHNSFSGISIHSLDFHNSFFQSANSFPRSTQVVLWGFNFTYP